MIKARKIFFSQFIVRTRCTELHKSDLKLMVALPAADWIYDYAGIGKSADAVILMNYDQHWRTSPWRARSCAVQDWFTKNIEAITKLVPPSKLVMGIASYAYDWPSKAGLKAHEQAKVESFQESIVTATESEATVQFDSDSLNPYYSYSDEHTDHAPRLDAVGWRHVPYNELRAAERSWRAGHGDLALFGSEDPPIWPIWDIARPTDADSRQARRYASGLRSDPRRRWRHLEIRGHAAKRKTRHSLRCCLRKYCGG